MNIRSKATRGSALVVTIILVTVASIGIALVVRRASLKKVNADTDQTVAMLREANKTLKQQLGSALMENIERGVSMGGSAIQTRLDQIDRSLRAQYPAISSVFVSTGTQQDVQIDINSLALQPNTNPQLTNPFRLFTGTYAPESAGPSYAIEIGYRNTTATNPTDRGNAEFLHGYQTTYQTRFSGQVLGAENIGWGHYAPQYFAAADGSPVVNRSAVVDLDLWANAPVFVRPPQYTADGLTASTTAIEKTTIGSYRSSSIYLNAAAVSTTAGGGATLNYSGVKAIFARKGFSGNAPLNLQELGPVPGSATVQALGSLSASDLSRTGRASGFDSRAAIDARVAAATPIGQSISGVAPASSALTQPGTTDFLSRFVYTEAQISGARFSVLSEKGVQEASAYRADGADFWSTSSTGSRAVSSNLFTPASRASVRVNLEAVNTATGVEPAITRVYRPETNTSYEGESWVITDNDVDGVPGATYRPLEPTFWSRYAEHLAYDQTTGSEVPPGSSLVIDGVSSSTDRSLSSAANRSLLSGWVKAFCPTGDILQGYQVVTMSGSNLQIFLHGAVARYNLPRQASMYPHGAVVVDMSMLNGGFPVFVAPTGAKDAGTQYGGVFVDVVVPGDLTSNTEKRTVYRDLLNGAMILRGRDYPTVGTIGRSFRTDVPSDTAEITAGRARLTHYTAKFDTTATNVTYVLGTNGRITFDTSTNINLGTQLGDNGELRGNALANNESLRTNMDAFYGDTGSGGVPLAVRATNPLADPGIHHAIFASRIRPALACFITAAATGTMATLGADPNVTNHELLFNTTTGIAHPQGATRLLTRVVMPNAYPVNGYVNTGLRSKFQSTLVVTPVYDGLLLAAKPTDWDGRELHVTTELSNYAASYIRANVGQPSSPLYSSALAARFNSNNPVLQALSADLLNPASNDTLIGNLGRKEDQSFVRVSFQRYGMSADYLDTYTARGSYNFRVQFSGNIKEVIERDCRVNGVLTPQIFRPLQQAQVTRADHSVVNYTFANCPLPGLVGVPTTASITPQPNTTLTGQTIAQPLRTYTFFHPAAHASEEGPASMAAAVTAYLQPGEARTLEAIVQAAPRLSTPYVEILGTATGNAALQTAIETRASALVRDSRFTLDTNSASWVALLSLSPFFGEIEYILADSMDTEAWVNNLPHDQKIYGAWCLNEGLRLLQVRILQYPAPSQVMHGTHTDNDIPGNQFSSSELTTFRQVMDTQSLVLLGAEMQSRLSSPSAIASITTACLPVSVTEMPPSQMDGQIGGRIKFFAPRSLTDLSPAAGWSFYYGAGGHTKLNGNLDLDEPVSQNITVVATQPAWIPTYNVAVQGPMVAVRSGMSIDRLRHITASVYEPIGSSSTEFLNTTTGLGFDVAGNSVLSTEVESALVERGVTFKLFSSLAFNDSAGALLTGFDFSGAGTILTAADSPHPTLTPNIFMKTGSSLAGSDVFAWHGSIKTGIGLELPTDVAEALSEGQPNYDILRPITFIYGDPLLTNPVWGKLSTVSENPTSEQKETFGRVLRKQ